PSIQLLKTYRLLLTRMRQYALSPEPNCMWHTTSHKLACFAAVLFSLVRPALADSDPKSHWAFQPVPKPDLPSVHNSPWVRTPVDAFILTRLDERNWTPAAPASKLALIRRVYFDLTGLPPTPEAVQSFVRDESPGAYEQVVDQLLNSRQYAERW